MVCPKKLSAASSKRRSILLPGETASRRPVGWDHGCRRQRTRSISWLKQASLTRWIGAWDDQPVWMRTRGGPILSIPYPQEVNDSNAIAVRRMNVSDFADMIVDNFEEMLRQAADGPCLVMGIALHANIAGQPFRLPHLRRALRQLAAQADKCWFTSSGAMAECFSTQVAPD